MAAFIKFENIFYKKLNNSLYHSAKGTPDKSKRNVQTLLIFTSSVTCFFSIIKRMLHLVSLLLGNLHYIFRCI